MGEISDMMIEGILCIGCGGFVQEEAPGHPVYCSKECHDWHGGPDGWYDPKTGLLTFAENEQTNEK